MNERIQELAQQAFINAGYDTKDELFDILFKQGAEFHEKFAELIVRECAQVLEINGDNQRTIRMTESTGHNKTTDWMEGYEEAVKQYGGYLLKENAKQIKQHFGVEE